MPNPNRKLVEIRDGKEIYQYPSGEKRYAGGAYAEQPPWAHPSFDSETGSALATKRQEAIREAAAQGLVEGHRVETEAEAARAGTRAMAEMIEEKKGVASVQAFRASWQAAGWLSDRNAQPQVQAIQINISPDLVQRYAQDDNDIVDAVPEDEREDSESVTGFDNG